MFNRKPPITTQAPQHHHHHTTINEHRAPTDESIRLLREMEAKAREQVERAIRLQDNGFECVAQVSHDLPTGDLLVIVHFKLSGNQMRVEHRHKQFTPREELGPAIVKAVSDKIAEHVLTTLAHQLQSSRVFS